MFLINYSVYSYETYITGQDRTFFKRVKIVEAEHDDTCNLSCSGI